MNDDQTEEEKGVFALHDAVADLRDEEEAKELMAQGYRRVSNAHCMIARIDRPDWKEAMAAHGRPHDPKGQGRLWVIGLGEGSSADYYRRCLSKDKKTVSRNVSKMVKSSCHDPCGYVPYTEDTVIELRAMLSAISGRQDKRLLQVEYHLTMALISLGDVWAVNHFQLEGSWPKP